MKNGPYLKHILNESGAEHMHHLPFPLGNWRCNLKQLTETQCLHVLLMFCVFVVVLWMNLEYALMYAKHVLCHCTEPPL